MDVKTGPARVPNPSRVEGRYFKIFVKGSPDDEVPVQVIFSSEWLVNCKDLMRMSNTTPATVVSRVFRNDRGYAVKTLTKGEVQACGGVFDANSDQWVEIAAAGMYIFKALSLGTGDQYQTKLVAFRALLLATSEVFAVHPPLKPAAPVPEPAPAKDAKKRKVRIGSDDLVGYDGNIELHRRAESTWAALRSDNVPFSEATEEPLSQTEELTQVDVFAFPPAEGKHSHAHVGLC
jgi:hypothetical protein